MGHSIFYSFINIGDLLKENHIGELFLFFLIPFNFNIIQHVSTKCELSYLVYAMQAISTATSRSASQSFLLQLKRFLKCINHTIPRRSDTRLPSLSPYFKVYNGTYSILRELGRTEYLTTVRSCHMFAFRPSRNFSIKNTTKFITQM